MREKPREVSGNAEGIRTILPKPQQEETYRKPDGEEVDPEYHRDWSGWQRPKKR